MKVTFKTGSEVNYGSTNGELFFASNTKQIMLNGIKYIPKKLSELTNDSGFISSITKSMVEGVLTGNITSHTHSYLPLSGGTMSNTQLVTNLNADLLDGYHATYGNNKPWGTIPVITDGGYMDVGKHFEFHYDNTTGSDYSTVLMCTGNYSNIVNLPPRSGTLALLTDNVASASKWADARTITLTGSVTGSVSIDGSANVSLATALDMENKHLNVGTITVKDSINAYSISATNSITCDNKDVSLDGHTHTFASLESKPTTLSGYGIADAMRFIQSDASNYVGARFIDTSLATKAANAYIEFWQGAGGWFNLKAGKFITNGGTSSQFLKGDGSLDSNTYALSSALGNYLPLTGGTLNGALTVPKLTSTGGILLGDSSLSAMVGSIGIQRHDETGFIGFLKDFNLGNSFNGVVLGWDGNYSLQENSVRIDASTFTYKGNSVLHSGNLGYISSGLSRAVQKDTNGNLYIVAPSLFEQGISNNYPKNLRWSNETEGQLVYDKEIEAGNFDTVEIGIPLADGTSKGFLKSTSTVTNVTGYTPCPVVSGTPYYKEDCLYLGSTEIGYTGIMEYGIQYTFNYGTKLPYLEDYTPDSIPRCVVLCFPDRSSNYRFLFWLSAFDEGDPYIARFYNSAYETWLTIDTASRQIILSYGNTWQS